MLGEYVRARRKAQGWTQEQLAARAGVDQTFISQVETGRVAQPSFAYFRRLADGLGVPVDELMGVAGLLEGPGPAEDSGLGQVVAFLERDADLRAQLEELRAAEPPEVYAQVVSGLAEVWKSHLRMLRQTRRNREG